MVPPPSQDREEKSNKKVLTTAIPEIRRTLPESYATMDIIESSVLEFVVTKPLSE